MAPPRAVWTDRGFRWQSPRGSPFVPGLVFGSISGLVFMALVLALLAVWEPLTLIAIVPAVNVVGVAMVRWVRRLGVTLDACEVELAGRTVRYRARHVLVELDLERLGIDLDLDTLTLTDRDERIRIQAGDDADWLHAALTEAQHTWRTARGGPMPDAERVALARLRDPG